MPHRHRGHTGAEAHEGPVSVNLRGTIETNFNITGRKFSYVPSHAPLKKGTERYKDIVELILSSLS